MLQNSISSELLRLQLHPVNLSVSTLDQHQFNLRGSLVEYWDIATPVNGAWLLEVLQSLPNAAGPQVVMDAIATAQAAPAAKNM